MLGLVSAHPLLKSVNLFDAKVNMGANHHLDNNQGDLSIYSESISAKLSGTESWKMANTYLHFMPLFGYKATQMRLTDTLSNYPFKDENLHALSLSGVLFYGNETDPLIFGAFGSVNLTSDFDHITEQDFNYHTGFGAGFQFSRSLVLGAGITVLDINRDPYVMAGPFLIWSIDDSKSFSIMGPNLDADWKISPSWHVSVKGELNSGTWNIETAQSNSRVIDLSGYRIGLFSEYNISGNLWLSTGIGTTLATNLELKSAKGDDVLLSQDVDSGLFTQIGLTLKSW